SMMHDQPMLAIHRVLHVISHTSPLVGTHHAGLVLTHDELMQPLYLHKRLGWQVIGMSALQVLQRRLDRTAINHFSGLTAVSLVQFGQITGDLRLQLALLTLELRQAQMLALRRYRLKLAAIDGHELPAEQPHLATDLDEGAAGRLKSSAVVL